jgi:hypothetical protein
MGILKETPITKMDHEVVMSLMDMMAAYTSKATKMADIAWTSLDDFMRHASDYITGSNWKEFQKDVKSEYPVLEGKLNEAKYNFSKMYPNSTDLERDIVAWYRSLKKDVGEKYATEMRADLVEVLMKEGKLNEDILDDAKAALENEYDWTNIEFEGDLSVRFDYDRGKNSMWVNKSGSISGNVPSRNARSVWKALDKLGLKENKLTEVYNTEDATMAFTDELNDEGITAEIFDAEGDGRSVKAQFTNKKWDDGVPVTKYLSRGGYKSVSTPRGGFRVIETSEFWYYEIDGGWAAVNRKKNGTPPFEY